MALRGGANGLIVGGYLTTSGSPMREDFEMLKRAGFKSAGAAGRPTPAPPA